MLSFKISSKLEKQLAKLGKKDKVLATICFKKISEIIQCDEYSIEHYKNLYSPLNRFKRIHLTDNFILLFEFDRRKQLILFVKISHWDGAYK